jgi:serine/threonine protein kinase
LGHTVILKLEPLGISQHMLEHEFNVYKKLVGGVGIPHVHWFGTEAGFNAMAIDCLGPSLENLFTRHRYQFTRRTVLTIAIQLVSNSTLKHDLWTNRSCHVQLQRLQFIHSRNLIHCDLKPSNIMIGVGVQADVVHLIDFGLSKEFRDAKTHRHTQMIPHTKPHSLVGTAVFASINSHMGLELGRKDDLESLAYVLIYLLHGALPWQGLSSSFDILEMKKRISARDLCHGLSIELCSFLEYCRSLPFDHKPDYEHFINLFNSLLHHEGPSNGAIFDLEADGNVAEVVRSDSTHSRDPEMVKKSSKRKPSKAHKLHTR